MDSFQSTLGQIRPEKVAWPKAWPRTLEKLNECLLDHQLWFLPVPRGFAANYEPALHMLHTRRVQKSIQEFCAQFDVRGPSDSMSFGQSLQFLFAQCPSLESMVFIKHDPKVVSAWIYLMVHHKEYFSKIGPKLDYEDPVFLLKVASLTPGFLPEDKWNTDDAWMELWNELFDEIQDVSFQELFSDLEVTALPEKSIRFDHFIKNQCCDDALIRHLEKQRRPLYELGLASKVENLDDYFWVDPDPVYLDQIKTFRVLVYHS